MSQSPETLTKLENLKEIFQKIDDSTIRAIRAFESLKAIDTLAPLLNRTYEANTAAAIQEALVHETILCVKRVHDAPNRDKATMKSLVDALEDKHLRQHLIDKANAWLMPQGHNIAQMIQDIRRDYPAFFAGADILALKDYRDKSLAHILLKPKAHLLFGQIEDALTFTVATTNKLSIIYTGADRNYDSSHDKWKTLGKKFTHLIELGMKEKERLKAEKIANLYKNKHTQDIL